MPSAAPDVVYKEVDISRDRAAMLKYNIQATPTIVILDAGGSTSDTLVGVPTRQRLASALEKVSSR
jgi:protein-disulfide isomerase